MLSVPILAGSCAYAIAEAAAWRGSLDDRPKNARGFYAVLAVAVGVGLLLDFGGFDAVAMLFWSAVVNGVLAPPLIVLVVLLTSDPKVMGTRVSGRSLRLLGWTTAIVMAVAAAVMLVTTIVQRRLTDQPRPSSRRAVPDRRSGGPRPGRAGRRRSPCACIGHPRHRRRRSSRGTRDRHRSRAGSTTGWNDAGRTRRPKLPLRRLPAATAIGRAPPGLTRGRREPASRPGRPPRSRLPEQCPDAQRIPERERGVRDHGHVRREHRSCHGTRRANPRRLSARFADCTNQPCRMHRRPVRGHRPTAVLCSHRTVASLRGRLRLLTVSLTVAFGAAALLAVSHLRVLETSVTEILSRNYRSIEAAEGMARVLADLRLAVHDGR